ncbi:MAG: diphthine--ammonia ligase [Bacillota bacterium]|nr:diphthine--ammonia ligase [Bacillota bacterium]
MEQKVFVSWSGGKDSYLSLLKAREMGLAVHTLVTFMNSEERSMSHGLSRELLQEQASALGLPLEVEMVTWEDYENGFMRVTDRLKEKGITGGVFGDINLQEHRDWVEKMCSLASLSSFLPLFGMEEKEVLSELLGRGARLVLVSLRDDFLDEKWLGKEIDGDFYEVCRSRGVSPCGENGEYHTLAVDGPFFNSPLSFHPDGIEKVKEWNFLKVKKS